MYLLQQDAAWIRPFTGSPAIKNVLLDVGEGSKEPLFLIGSGEVEVPCHEAEDRW
jgi:hypothetical protein